MTIDTTERIASMPARAQPFSMRLMANGGEEATLDRNTPLILTVSIVDYEAIEAVSRRRGAVALSKEEGEEPAPQRVGSRSAPWTGLIRFFRIEDGRRQPLRWRTALLGNPKPDSIAVLDAYTSAVADFGVDAAVVATLTPGRYTIRASITGRTSSRRYEVESNDIMVELRERLEPKNQREAEERRLNSAYYDYRRGRSQPALSAVREVIARNPKNIRGLILLGDVQFAGRKYSEALPAYREAYRQFQAQVPPIEEEPRSLLAKIAATESKLAGRR